jgi:hypothetical protein
MQVLSKVLAHVKFKARHGVLCTCGHRQQRQKTTAARRCSFLLQVTAAELQQPGMEAAQAVEVIAPGRVAF